MPRLTGNEAPRLLRHITALRDHLLPFLSTRDVAALRQTGRGLLNDSAIAARAFAGHPVARCLLRGCEHDWCWPVPPVSPRSRAYCGSCRPRTADETVSALERELAGPQRCVALLSLARLMSSELGSLLHTDKYLYGSTYHILPFILPIARFREIEQQGPKLTSALGCHLANCSADDASVACALCSTLETADCDTFHERKDAEEEALEEQLLAEGHEDDSEEFEARMEEFRAAKDGMEMIVEEYGNWGADSRHVLARLCEDSSLPPLGLIDEAYDEDVDEACTQLYSHDPDNSFCAHQLQPVLAFFESVIFQMT